MVFKYRSVTGPNVYVVFCLSFVKEKTYHKLIQVCVCGGGGGGGGVGGLPEPIQFFTNTIGLYYLFIYCLFILSVQNLFCSVYQSVGNFHVNICSYKIYVTITQFT